MKKSKWQLLMVGVAVFGMLAAANESVLANELIMPVEQSQTVAISELNRAEVKKAWLEFVELKKTEAEYTPESWKQMFVTIGEETGEKNPLGVVSRWANTQQPVINVTPSYTLAMIQADVDTAVASLRTAIGQLVKVGATTPTPEPTPTGETEALYRVYNKNNGEHFYTNSLVEKNQLTAKGWLAEGIGWYASQTGIPVYRVYNPNSGEHHYTVSIEEKSSLITAGWKDEGTGWYAAADTGVPIYRVYNPNARDAGSHHYTKDKAEVKQLLALGWKDEGIGWYAAS